ncbi:MAG: PAS domain-containing hybrid sensor histidine kinase/response regulator [Telluria sp.]
MPIDRYREDERFRTLFAHAPFSVQLLDVDGRTLQVNDAWRRLWGVDGGDAIADYVLSGEYNILADPQLEAKGIAAYLRRAFAGESVQIPAITYDPAEMGMTGRARVVRASAHPIHNGDGKVIEVMLVHEDVTEQVRAETALRDSEARFRAITDAMPQLVWTTDAHGAVTWCNQQWYEYTGLAPGSTRGADWEDALHPDDRERIRDAWAAAVAGSRPIEDKFRLRSAAGEYRWMLTRAVPVHDAAGAIIEWLGTNTDIDDWVQAQAELADNARRKDEFLAMLAHELRNPLAPVRSAAELLGLGRLDAARVDSASKVIIRQVQHMSNLLDDLLDVSRVTRGLAVIDQEPQDMRHVVQLALEQVRPLVESKGHRLVLSLAPERAGVLGDEKRLVQVVANLLGNAARYTPEQGRITVTLDVAADTVRLTVEDNGIGIAPELQPRIFDLFVQGQRHADRSQGGLGLGLALVRRLVELHGGTVGVHSDGERRGARFTVTLPRQAAAPAAQDATEEAAAPGGAHRILIVDDNADAANMLGELLQVAGHTVAVQYTPSTALQRAAGFKPNICLVDIGLPEMDGMELACRLRALPGLERARMLAVTGYGQQLDSERMRQAGFERHLLKPVDWQHLTRALDGDSA